jgi:hypothetical protein
VIGLAGAAVVLGCVCPSRAEGADVILDIIVDLRGGVDGGDLVFARDTAQRIYAAAGIRLNWHEGEDPNAPRTRPTIVIITNDSQMVDVFGSPNILGRVVQPGVRAYVQYDRVAQFARDHDKEPGIVLGGVIAHEIGHLLLGDAHSATGIMSAAMDTRPAARFAFLPEQIVTLRRALSTSSARIPPQARRPLKSASNGTNTPNASSN